MQHYLSFHGGIELLTSYTLLRIGAAPAGSRVSFVAGSILLLAFLELQQHQPECAVKRLYIVEYLHSLLSLELSIATLLCAVPDETLDSPSLEAVHDLCSAFLQFLD